MLKKRCECSQRRPSDSQKEGRGVLGSRHQRPEQWWATAPRAWLLLLDNVVNVAVVIIAAVVTAMRVAELMKGGEDSAMNSLQ
jgi:hypothetical protein